MKKIKLTIQVVENSDRFHVSQDGVPTSTLLFGNGISKEFAQMNANANAFLLCQKLQQQGFDVAIKKQEIK